ncbi:FeoA family protein [Actinotalea sp.]|uniref:FeoA family protein n=1 Tax=Actinotalea sp. TaxID=1872145 RepID=UPI002D14F3EF|nr:FeoA family protein [Actinotalea sp.]HQY32976.1 FeoA family protein [Actinotalea sp.]HRA51322.1 FeoA family protein [Actinotalea sp.]
MQLRACPVGAEVEIVALGLPDGALLRMGEMGLRAGSRVRVTHRAPLGGRVVAVGTARLALDGATAASVEVRTLR